MQDYSSFSRWQVLLMINIWRQYIKQTRPSWCHRTPFCWSYCIEYRIWLLSPKAYLPRQYIGPYMVESLEDIAVDQCPPDRWRKSTALSCHHRTLRKSEYLMVRRSRVQVISSVVRTRRRGHMKDPSTLRLRCSAYQDHDVYLLGAMPGYSVYDNNTLYAYSGTWQFTMSYTRSNGSTGTRVIRFKH